MFFRGYNFSTNEPLINYTIEEINYINNSFDIPHISNCKSVNPRLRKDFAIYAIKSNIFLQNEIRNDELLTEIQKEKIYFEIKKAQFINNYYRQL